MDHFDRYLDQVRRNRFMKDQWVTWLDRYEWLWFCTFTFRLGIRRKSAGRLFLQWAREVEKRESHSISWLRVAELSRQQQQLHFHVLIAGLRKFHSHYETRWRELAGICVYEPYDPEGRALPYSLKSLETTDDPDIDWELHPQHLHPDCARQQHPR